ncbi:MAG: T9SS type A sorting domain-containing protein [Fibromonadales bacterium]|nr:T9SS type A sorting domain-containing protein [Fibromonadales bacterium]
MFQLDKTLAALVLAFCVSQPWAQTEYCLWDECYRLENPSSPNAENPSMTNRDACISYSNGLFSDPACTNLIAGGPDAPQSGQCEDSQGRGLFCDWGTGCYRLNPNEEQTTCAAVIAHCSTNGNLFYGVNGSALTEDNKYGEDLQCAEIGGKPATVGSNSSSSTNVSDNSSSSASNATFDFTPDNAEGYPIFEYRGYGENIYNRKTAYGDYVFIYSYEPEGNYENDTDENGPIVFIDGVAKLINTEMGQAPTELENNYHGAVIAIKNSETGAEKNLSQCNSISYYYKGAAHEFQLEFSPILCSDEESDGSNKWGIAEVPEKTEWTKRVVAKSDLDIYNHWDASKCGPDNAPEIDFSKVMQIGWEVNNKTAPAPEGKISLKSSLEIAHVFCITGSDSPSSSSAGDDGSPSSSSSVDDSPSSSSGGSFSFTYCLLTSDKICLTGHASCPAGTIGSNDCPWPVPIIISKIANANGAQIIKNGISLQVTRSATLEVFDLSGKRLRKLNFASGNWSVPLADLPKGLYIIKANFGSSQKILRLPVN